MLILDGVQELAAYNSQFAICLSDLNAQHAWPRIVALQGLPANLLDLGEVNLGSIRVLHIS
jgi:hypothetical protein